MSHGIKWQPHHCFHPQQLWNITKELKMSSWGIVFIKFWEEECWLMVPCVVYIADRNLHRVCHTSRVCWVADVTEGTGSGKKSLVLNGPFLLPQVHSPPFTKYPLWARNHFLDLAAFVQNLKWFPIFFTPPADSHLTGDSAIQVLFDKRQLLNCRSEKYLKCNILKAGSIKCFV